MEKVWGPPAESEKKTRYGADILHIRSVPVAWVVRGGMHETSPNFGRQWACPSSGPTQDLNEFGHQTHVASRPVSVFGAFQGENHRKFIRCRKIMKTCRHDGPADEYVRKKCGVHRLSKKRERSSGLTSFISDQCRLHGTYEVATTKGRPTLGCSGHAHLRAPRKS